MDWSKTKSILIVVFLILNIFLLSMYLNRYNEAQSVEILGEKTIESRLQEDNITYVALPNTVDQATYISGRVKTFRPNDFSFINQSIQIKNGTHIVSSFFNPVRLRNPGEDSSLIEFVNNNVLNGSSYMLWHVNKEKKYALFFQRIDSMYTIYYNQNGYVKVYWNDDGEVYQYEQTMLERLENLEQAEDILPPIQVIQALYSKGLLKTNSHITGMRLGYSTVVQLTQTQVFVPTWQVRVNTEDGEEEFFVNAVEGKIIEIPNNLLASEEE